MEVLIMIAQLLLGLTILVGVHELGHLVAAKVFGMKVETYSIGFPPKVAGKKFGETEYVLGAIPLGGYVKIAGMMDESLDKEQLRKPAQPWEFRAKPAWQRLIVMLGGIIVNVITGIIIFAIVVYTTGESYLPAREAHYGIVASPLAKEIGLQTGDHILQVNGKNVERFNDLFNSEVILGSEGYYTVERNGENITVPIPNDFVERLSSTSKAEPFVSPIAPFYIGKLKPGDPAEAAGLKTGDVVTAINGAPIRFFHEFQAELAKLKGKATTIDVTRADKPLHFNVLVGQDGRIGFTPELKLKYDVIHYSFLASIPKGAEMAFDVIWLNLKGFGKIFRREVSAQNAISSPIEMARSLYGGTWSWLNFWSITGLLSMVLAFMNLLPIPALDGGHVVFLLFEMVSGRKPSEKFLENAQKVGMVLLLSLMVFAFYNDIAKIVSPKKPAPTEVSK